MKSALVFCSPHGRTRQVVKQVLLELAIRPEVFELPDAKPSVTFQDYDLLIFFCPTYGDEELPEAMERFILEMDQDLSGCRFVLCELGNYYGYDDYSFGALRILRQRLEQFGARLLGPPLSLDSLPRVNWQHLSDWVDSINSQLAALDP